MTLVEYKAEILKTNESDLNKITCWGAGSGPSYRDRLTVWNLVGGSSQPPPPNRTVRTSQVYRSSISDRSVQNQEKRE